MSLPLSFVSFAEEGNDSVETGHLPGCAYAPAREETPCRHTHDDDCGYRAELAGTACQYVHVCSESCGCSCVGSPCAYEHIHDEICGYDPLTGLGCTDAHAHDALCGYLEADVLAHNGCCDVHVHDAFCGYSPDVQASPCLHVHDAFCGYTPFQAEVLCTCAQIMASQQENPPILDGDATAPEADLPTESPDTAELSEPATVADDDEPIDESADTEPAGGSNFAGPADEPADAEPADAPDYAGTDETPDEAGSVPAPVATQPEQGDPMEIPAAPPLDTNVTDIVADSMGTPENSLDGTDQTRQNARSFLIVIPGSLTLRSDISEMSIAVDGVQDGETILLTFLSENNFQLTDGTVAIPYSMFVDGAAVCGGIVYPCTVVGGCIRLQLEMGRSRFAGNYSDTLKFSISLPQQPETEPPEIEQPETEPSEIEQPEIESSEMESPSQEQQEPNHAEPLEPDLSRTETEQPEAGWPGADPLEIRQPEEIVP